MYSNEDISSVYSYLVNTPEGPLRKTLTNQMMTDTHVRLLAKLAKGRTESEFIENFKYGHFGSYSLSTAENVIRESFWSITRDRLSVLGLLPSFGQQAA